MAVGSIDLFRTAEVVLVASVLVHLCLLRPWNARADLLLTVEMIDKDLTAEIDRGALPVDDPVVADLQRCLSLSRKRADAGESLSNLLALLSPDPRSVPWSRADLWPPSDRLALLDQAAHLDQPLLLDEAALLDQGDGAALDAVARLGVARLGVATRLDGPARRDEIDRLDRLTASEQHILLEYSAELSAATTAYLRITSWPRPTVRQSFPDRPDRLPAISSGVVGGGLLSGGVLTGGVHSGAGHAGSGHSGVLHSGNEGVRHGNGVGRGWRLLRRSLPVRAVSVTTAQPEKKPPAKVAAKVAAKPAPELVEAPRILDLSITAERDPIDDEIELRTVADRVPVQTAGYEPTWDEYFQEGRSPGDRSLNQREFAERSAPQRPVIERPVIERPYAERPFSEPAYSQPFPERPFAERYFDEDIFDESAKPLPSASAPASCVVEPAVAAEGAVDDIASQRPQPERRYQRLSLDRASLDRLAANRLLNENRATGQPRRLKDHD